MILSDCLKKPAETGWIAVNAPLNLACLWERILRVCEQKLMPLRYQVMQDPHNMQ
jgi:hypothetical protein